MVCKKSLIISISLIGSKLVKIIEPKLKNCTHLLDLNYRELSYVISKSKFLVVYEGLFNHIASCFNKKTFVIPWVFYTQIYSNIQIMS